MKLDAVMKELMRRERRKGLTGDLHDGQKRILEAMQKSRFVAIRSPRRWGKTESTLRIGLDLADKLNARCVYLAMFRTQAKQIAWPIALELNEKYLNWKVNLVDLAIRGPGNRELMVMGADRPDLARLLRGWKNVVVIIDEAASWSLDLRDFVNSILRHTLTDLRGYLLMAGTPGWMEDGLFWSVCAVKEPGWECVTGNTFENPYTAVQQREEVEEQKRLNPDIEKEPWFKREYEGLWVADNRSLVYPFSDHNLVYNWTQDPAGKRILAIDWGGTAASAFTVAEFNEIESDKLTYVDALQQVCTFDDYVKILTELKNRWQPLITIADPGGTNKALTDELCKRCGLAISNAEKVDKEGAIAAFIRDLVLGRIQVALPQAEMLRLCWSKLQWVKKQDGSREEAGENHLADTALYARRAAWNWIHRPKERVLTEAEQIEKQVRDEAKKLADAMKKRKW